MSYAGLTQEQVDRITSERDALRKEVESAELAAAARFCGGKFARLGMEVGDLCDQKNRAYGDSAFVVAECLKVICPDGVKPEQYDLLCIFARDMDKWARLFRVGNDALGEDAAMDRVGYGLLLVERLRQKGGK